MRKRAGIMLLLVLVPALTLLAQTPVRSSHRADLTPELDRYVKERLDKWLTWYKDLHAHPELSLQETESARKMAERLTEAGYQVTSGVGGHGVVGVLSQGPGPTVMIRGDMDALPVREETGLPYASQTTAVNPEGRTVPVMHACGHDVHQTCLAAAAEALAHLKDRWSGTVMIVAQPAEEIGRGARMMIEDGLFERFARPNYCLALHVSAWLPAGKAAYAAGWAMANVDSVDITIYGSGGHGARPHQTIDPVVAAAHVVVALQTLVSRRGDPNEPAVVTVGSIHAGSKHNIIPDDAVLQLTVRSYSDRTRALLLEGIREIAVHTCRAMGCKKDPDVANREEEFTPATYNDPALAEAAMNVIRQVIGKDNVSTTKGEMTGEDFGRYSRALTVPGFMFWLGSVAQDRFAASEAPGGEPLPAIHSGKYHPDPQPTIETGVRCMASVALSLLDARKE